MVTVLLAPSRVASGGLNMAVGRQANPDVGPRGRYDEALGSEVTFVAMIARRRLIDRRRRAERQKRLVDEVKAAQDPPAGAVSRDLVAARDEASSGPQSSS